MGEVFDEKTLRDYYLKMSMGVQEVSENQDAEDDPVNHPMHYTSHPSGIECIDIAKHYDFCIGNVIKYVWRAGLKKSTEMQDEEKEIQDLEKAKWYLEKEIEEKKRKLASSQYR